MNDVLFVIPPGMGDMAANHEGAAGMGALSPEQNVFAYPPHTVAACIPGATARGWSVSVADGTGKRPGAFAAEVAGTTAGVVAVQVAVGTAESDLSFLRLLVHTRRQRLHPPILLFGASAGRAVSADWIDAGLAEAVLAGEPEIGLGPALVRVAGGAMGRLEAHSLAPQSYTPTGLLSDLDALPYPDWERTPWRPYEMVSLLSSRGCSAPCAYCAYVLTQGAIFRAQSVERTFAEWMDIAARIKPPYLIVRDPVFAQDYQRVAALCERLARQDLRLDWACESRPEHFDRQLVRVMKAAGCATIKIGMESGDPALLAKLGRTRDNETASAYLAQVGRVARWCEESGVRCRIFIMAGLPGQTAESLHTTVAALRRVAPYASVHPNVYRAYDGVALVGANQPVQPEILVALREANRTPSTPKRVLARITRTFARLGQVQTNDSHADRQSASTEAAGPFAPVVSARQLRPQQYLLAGSRVFLTGGSGFVGGHVARALVAAGAQVLALVRPNSPLGVLEELPIEIVRGDLTQPAAWSSSLNGCQFCFHLAALFAGPEAAPTMYAVNARATGALLGVCAAAGVTRFIHTGTVGTVGRPLNPARLPDEKTPFGLWDQSSHYVRSKRLGELIAASWNELGPEVVTVKPTAPVGWGDGTPARPPTATGRRILLTLQGKAISYPAGGVNHAPVEDIAAGCLLAAERGAAGETYILGHRDGNLDQEKFYHLIAQAAGTTGMPYRRPVAIKPASGLALTVDPRRAVDELGLPQSELLPAFIAAVEWYQRTFPKELSSDGVAA